MHGIHVTGIDLTPEFIEVSDYLSRRCGLADKLQFVNGDATELHFPLEYFDQAWTQHVAMNIPDKQPLYAGVYRVLKPGGAFGIYDAVLGGGQPVLYPTPWAREAGISFLATEQEYKKRSVVPASASSRLSTSPRLRHDGFEKCRPNKLKPRLLDSRRIRSVLQRFLGQNSGRQSPTLPGIFSKIV